MKTTIFETNVIRWFPIKLYCYIFGAAVFGWGVGTGMLEPNTRSLVALGIGSVCCVIGYFLMRPYMNAAKIAIAELTNAATAAREEVE